MNMIYSCCFQLHICIALSLSGELLQFLNCDYCFIVDKFNRLFPVTFRSFLSFSQTTLGVGFPTTEQLKVTLSPLTIVTFLGCMEISGATKKKHS